MGLGGTHRVVTPPPRLFSRQGRNQKAGPERQDPKGQHEKDRLMLICNACREMTGTEKDLNRRDAAVLTGPLKWIDFAYN